ncbi:hypothetical protein [Lutispora sp.]|uniref:hypothetical protein n=1 Tax=Lutispora sp. TaxID=2828727 RepID=UPI002B1EE544|nr:hypothetical protein [Lutispora sp.]MEA4963761.1 hypothetical protein [Lutispora sp.]
MKKWILSLTLSIMMVTSLTSCTGPSNLEQKPDSIETNKNIDRYKISSSQDGEKEIYCVDDTKLILVSNGDEKVIYENYRDITSNPYSIWDFDEYKIQWSKDSNYVYIIDSVYDLKYDKLIPIEDCVIFSWIDNRGVYLADGTYYEISYDGGLQNEMAVGKKIKIIENGVIEEKSKQIDDRYFVFQHYIDVDKPFQVIEDHIIINTASLKYREDELQSKIKEDFHSKKFKEFLRQDHNASLNKKYAELINLIKESTEFQELQRQITDLEDSYPIEFEGDIKEVMEKINNITYSTYNVSGKYYLKGIKEEEVQFR